jgi:hypothetical protein
LKEKICEICHEPYIPTGRNQKVCNKVSCKKEQQRFARLRFKEKHYPNYKGVGRGGSNKQGKAHHQYKSGIGLFRKRSKELLKSKAKCNRCGKNLLYVKHFYRCVHHKDRDRTNNSWENLELLCKRCHQLEHECIKNLLK